MSEPVSTLAVIPSKIALALLEVQREIGDVEKAGNNPHFDSKFADLNGVIDAIKPVLNKHGIVFIQYPVVPTVEGHLALATVLVHAESGESIIGVAQVPLAKSDPQAYGSAMTYARRYSLVTMTGLKAVDDDGNSSSNLPAPVQGKRSWKPVERTGEATPRPAVTAPRRTITLGAKKPESKGIDFSKLVKKEKPKARLFKDGDKTAAPANEIEADFPDLGDDGQSQEADIPF